MKLCRIGPNETTVNFKEGTVVLFSYSTPVAALLPSGRFVKTTQYYSKTTSRHINRWLAGTSPANVEPVSQYYLDELVGDTP